MLILWAYAVLGLLVSPFVAIGVVVHPRLRADWRERLGFPQATVEPGAVWFHAASLGERRLVDALVPALQAHEPGVSVLVSCTSAAARDLEAGVDQLVCLPVDLLPCVLAWLDRLRPRGLVLVEAELWPALLLGCRLRGVPVVRLAPREGPGMRRLRRVPGLATALLAGIPEVHPPGDLKQLAPASPPAFVWAGEALVAGSTRDGEEADVLDAWATLSPRPLLILAPREPVRFSAVAALLGERHPRWLRRSALAGAVPPDVQVVLLDTLGELGGLYAAARAAFVGGTFVASVGGHSPAEAVAAGCPVVRGPHTHANAPAWGGVEADVAETPAALAAAFARALARPRTRPPAAVALDGVIAALAPVLDAPPLAERPLRPWFWPLAGLWLLAAALRPARLAPTPIPVISVGGLTAGGSGKTPVAAWLASRLPGSVVVSRGYGRRAGNDVRTSGGAAELGDELAMLERRGQAVACSPDRAAAIAAAARAGARVAVLDDGLQARAVARALEVVVLDARWPDGGGPIPVGTRRVPRSWVDRADVLWCNHGPPPEWAMEALRPGTVVVHARYRPVGWRHRGKLLPLDALPARPVAALAGIARPEGFFRLLRGLGLRLAETRVFADHHRFRWTDLQAIEAWKDDHVVVVTEKDAARLPEGLGVWALVVEPELASGAEALAEKLAAFGAKP